MILDEDSELKRQSLLLETLNHTESFQLWRKEVCDPQIEQIEALLANSDTLPEAVVRANVKLKYLLKDIFYQVFERIRVVNEQEREVNNLEK